jgi:hypothetical protein
MPVDSAQIFQNKVKSVEDLYRQYSADDVASALFVSTTWLPNTACPIKHLFFATVLCSVSSDDFLAHRKMNSYSQFRQFLEVLYALSPDFFMLEDYLPEMDWGEIKYPLEKERYRIFYGGDITNPVDQLMQFELLYGSIDEKFSSQINRSPIAELRKFLQLQETIIGGISGQPHSESVSVSPGDCSLPPEIFWREATKLYANLPLEEIVGGATLRNYVIELGNQSLALRSQDRFVEAVTHGRCLNALCVQCKGELRLLLPRRINEILILKWEELYERHHAFLFEDKTTLQQRLAREFATYCRQRIPKEELFLLVSACTPEGKPCDLVFPVAVHSNDRLILFYLLTPVTKSETLEFKLGAVSSQLQEAKVLLGTPPTNIVARLAGQRIEFHPEGAQRPLNMSILIVVPQSLTNSSLMRLTTVPPETVLSYDEALAIIDEIDGTAELSNFLNYLDTLKTTSISPLSSMLDKFASFRDAEGVLLDGALTPDYVLLDPHWGARFRYESLANFWRRFPARDFFGPPRSWRILDEGPSRFRLEARSFLCSALSCAVGQACVFITTPYEKLSHAQARLADFLMQCIQYSLCQYSELLSAQRVFLERPMLIIQLFPYSLVGTSKEFAHLRHLNPENEMWQADCGLLDSDCTGLRIVFDEDKVTEAFLDAPDRSKELDLLQFILRKFDSCCQDPGIAAISETIERDKWKRPRYKLFSSQRHVSFPELHRPCEPTAMDFKLARKLIAEMAKKEGISEGRYDLAAGKELLNRIRKLTSTEIDTIVRKYDYDSSIKKLIGWADAVTHQREQDRTIIMNSLDQEVDYQRDDRMSETQRQAGLLHRNYRYAIEKFVQLRPKGGEAITEDGAMRLLAIIDWLMVIQSASDIIHYDIEPAGLIIGRDFLPEVEYSEEMKGKHEQYGKEQSQIMLGMIGETADAVRLPNSVSDLLAELDEAFDQDYAFRFSNAVTVLALLSQWPIHNTGIEEAPYYEAKLGEIASTVSKAIPEMQAGELDRILDFLTLRSEDMLLVLRDSHPCDDLPVWEYKKRFARYTIKPLILLDQKYVWGPYAARGSGLIWSGAPGIGTLPVDIGKNSINRLLQRWKKQLDDLVEAKAAEIVKRYTPYVHPSARLHRLDRRGNHPSDLGDYDVLAYEPRGHAILSIECKNILPVHCLKDARRLRDTIFGVPGESQGHFGQVEKRHEYLVKHWVAIADPLGWRLSSKETPRIISLYVSAANHFWTRFPPRSVNCSFVLLEMLSNYLENSILREGQE